MNSASVRRHLISSLFVPRQVLPPSASSTLTRDSSFSISTRLLIQQGFIRPSQQCTGVFTLLPLALRALDKMHQRVDACMQSIGAQKISLPHLSSLSLWEASGRSSVLGPELIRLSDRRKHDYVLNPTAEETITSMVANTGAVSGSRLPLMLYQIGTKFRDELNPKMGLIRAREFVMKDLYTFDADLENAQKTYHRVVDTYHRLLSGLEVPYYCVRGSSGAMGGQLSHEFHTPAEIGQDKVLICSKCRKMGVNTDFESDTQVICQNCEGENELEVDRTIEVGHCFLLGDKYSKAFKAKWAGTNLKNLEMGCFGIGTTRLLSAAIEVLSSSSELRWPSILVPYSVIVLSPKKGSKEAIASMDSCMSFYDALNTRVYVDDCLLDDRGSMTVGKKLFEAKKSGFKFIVLFGKDVLQTTPLVELYELKAGGESTMEKLSVEACLEKLETEAEKASKLLRPRPMECDVY